MTVKNDTVDLDCQSFIYDHHAHYLSFIDQLTQ